MPSHVPPQPNPPAIVQQFQDAAQAQKEEAERIKRLNAELAAQTAVANQATTSQPK